MSMGVSREGGVRMGCGGFRGEGEGVDVGDGVACLGLVMRGFWGWRGCGAYGGWTGLL